jgi:large subunit ribosomal protein L9
MDVILRSDVANLGRAGEVVKVRNGYARNFLIPRGLAYQASQGNIRRLESEARAKASRVSEQAASAEGLAGQLAQVQLTFAVKAGDGDRLFGSVTGGDIAAQLGTLGFKIDKRDVELEEPIRMIGQHRVPIRLHAAVRGEVRVSVVKE